MRKLTTALAVVVSCLSISAFAEELEVAEDQQEIAILSLEEEESEEALLAKQQIAQLVDSDCGCGKPADGKPRK